VRAQAPVNQQPPIEFGDATPPAVRGRAGGGQPRIRTQNVDLALAHWSFLLRVLCIFVILLIALMIINYAAQYLKLTPVIEFKDFAQYVIPLFAFLLVWGAIDNFLFASARGVACVAS
jgi:hypothetical protein